jgi:hypothetical protein
VPAESEAPRSNIPVPPGRGGPPLDRAEAELKERGFDSPYLKNFVVARVNPLRFQGE